MTWPSEYQQACTDFEKFMVAARDEADLPTTNAAWNMVQGVLFAFRRRLDVQETVRFASVLPPLVRAMFLEGWNPQDGPRPFAPREALLAEVKALRAQHNFSPDTAIECVATALRRCVDRAAFDRVLDTLSPAAQAFWREGVREP